MNPQRIITNLTGKHTRYETLHGRTYLVVPMSMLTEGIHNGSGGPLYYPREELAKSPEVWNMKPVVVYHPTTGTATTLEELAARMVGIVMNATWDGHKLRAEAWLEPARLEAVDRSILEALESGRTLEISTGLFTDNEYAPGVWGGRQYDFIARNHRPDHLAILPMGVGACSVADGCGLLQTNKERNAMYKDDDDILPLPTMNFGNGECMYLGQATPEAPGADDDILPLPTMNFAKPCGCRANATMGDGGPTTAPACGATLQHQAIANNATGGDDDVLPLPSTL